MVVFTPDIEFIKDSNNNEQRRQTKMQKFKHILKSIFCLSPFLTVIIALPSFALVIYALAFRHLMLSLSGGVISLIVLGMAFYMIIHASRILKKQV